MTPRNSISSNSLISCAAFIALLVMGCASRPATMLSSTSPLPPGVRGTLKTSASDCQYFLLGFIPLTGSASAADALEEAKSNVNVDVLTDVTEDSSGGYYILWANSCIRVSGMGVPRELLRN
jgi:hypothetical protein